MFLGIADGLTNSQTIVGGMSQSTAYLYDDNSNLARYTPPGQFFTYRIDQLNRENRMQFGTTGGFVTKTLDAHDRVLTAEDQLSHTTSYVYDGFGDLIGAKWFLFKIGAKGKYTLVTNS